MSKSKILETTKGQNTFMIDPRNIEVEEGFNGRITFDRTELDDLKASVKENGVLTPLELKKIRGTDKYKLIDGERRHIVSMELIEEGYEMRVPAIMFVGNDVDALVHMLIKNDNVPFSFVEEANVIKRLKSHGLTDKEITLKTGRKKAYLLSLERILTAPEDVKKLITDNRISHTLVLEKITDQNVDPDQAFAAIRKLASPDATEGGKKIRKQQLDAELNKTNSFKELKIIVKEMESATGRELKDNANTDLLIDFVKKLVNNEFTGEELDQLFFN